MWAGDFRETDMNPMAVGLAASLAMQGAAGAQLAPAPAKVGPNKKMRAATRKLERQRQARAAKAELALRPLVAMICDSAREGNAAGFKRVLRLAKLALVLVHEKDEGDFSGMVPAPHGDGADKALMMQNMMAMLQDVFAKQEARAEAEYQRELQRQKDVDARLAGIRTLPATVADYLEGDANAVVHPNVSRGHSGGEPDRRLLPSDGGKGNGSGG